MNKTFQKGEILCREGVFETWMYEIVKGQVAVYAGYGTENQQKLAVINDGFVGEMGVIDSRPRSASVVAEEDTEVILITQEEFREYFTNHPEKIKEIMVILTKRLDEMNALYMEALKTVRDYLKVYGENKPMGDSLKAAVKKFSEIFRKRTALVAACVMLSAAAVVTVPTMNTTAYANSGGIDEMAGYGVQDANTDMFVITDCNVREAPTTNSRIVNGLSKGSRIHVSGIVCCNGIDAGWRRVIVTDATFGGTTAGYIAANLLSWNAPAVQPAQQVQPSQTPARSTDANLVPASGTLYVSTTEGANVRASASLNGAIVGHTYYGDAVTLLGFSGEWSKISVGGVQGYIYSTLLSANKPAAKPAPSQAQPSQSTNYSSKGLYVVAVDSGYLALRSQKAYDASNEIAKLYTGTPVEVLEGSGTYWTVRLPGTNTIGYVNSNYLK